MNFFMKTALSNKYLHIYNAINYIILKIISILSIFKSPTAGLRII